MQLKLLYQGEEVKCEDKTCDTPYCSRDYLMKVVRAMVRPQLVPVIHRIFEVQELFHLADVVSLGENQMHHTLRMAEFADMIREDLLKVLGVDKDELLVAVMFHDVGKGVEIDDASFEPEKVKQIRVPRELKKYVPAWVEFKEPLHLHVTNGVNIAKTYHLPEGVVEAIALHHHVKIYPQVLKDIAAALSLAPMICNDILSYQPEQYAVKGSNLTQIIAILDQLCAIERKFNGRLYLSTEPDKMEDELVRELVIGVADTKDPRLDLLGLNIEGNETVILLDLKGFGAFVQLHNEYQVQAVKKEILNTIRSVVRVQDRHRNKDVVGLIGGDEFVIITKVAEEEVINKIVQRVFNTVEARTGFKFRFGYGIGGSIPANFHEARTGANLEKKLRFVK